MYTVRRLAVAVVTAFLVVVGLGVPVCADNVSSISITGTVNLRTGPSTDAKKIGSLSPGDRPEYLCHATGERIGGGPGVGTTLWWQVRYEGRLGYYSSAYDNVPYDRQSNIAGYYHIYRCGSKLAMQPSYGYDRGLAVWWALQYARDLQPKYPDSGCTWFVSQAMWAGRMPQSERWRDPIVGRIPRVATYAEDLYWYLRDELHATVIPLNARLAPGKNAVPEAQVGDLIAYDWEGDGHVSHMSIIVHMSPGFYPDVAEWGTADGPGTRSSYAWRGWTWSENQHKWLQEVYGDKVTPYLIHLS